MDKEIAEEIIRENRYPSGYDIQDYLFDNEDTVLSPEVEVIKQLRSVL